MIKMFGITNANIIRKFPVWIIASLDVFEKAKKQNAKISSKARPSKIMAISTNGVIPGNNLGNSNKLKGKTIIPILIQGNRLI
ncbi:hypothetical protein SAMN05192573_104420 [Mucilaginibacter gossypii]|uniref:Uncharacterized protein n=1 Tax=Mucilaginibacter gossypii TaxID=551996 RepID=A0A1G7WGZ4_9SPHI|nr:hypothetical protein SAMN05192573_104420 [Mucilaginibacter gossypii]